MASPIEETSGMDAVVTQPYRSAVTIPLASSCEFANILTVKADVTDR